MIILTVMTTTTMIIIIMMMTIIVIMIIIIIIIIIMIIIMMIIIIAICLISYISIFTALEVVGPTKRTLAGIIALNFWVVGVLLTDFLAWLIRDAFWLHLCLAIPGLLQCLYVW